MIVAIVALACGSISGMIATFTHFEIVDRVNDKLPKGEQFDALGWYASKYQRLHRDYRRLYPDGGLVLKARLLMALMIACGLICAWSLGLFAK
jgi:hypothetical protein